MSVGDISRSQFSNVTGFVASTRSVDEGSVATFTVSTTNVDPGAFVPYTISGISGEDLVSGEPVGYVTIVANGPPPGSSMQDIAKLIADIKLIEQVIGDESNSAWVKHVYKNVVGAEPDLLTEAVFVNWLTTGAYSRGDLLALAADLPLLESQVDITGYKTNGMAYSSFI